MTSRFAHPSERTQVADRIDPDTAEVFFIYAQTLDPYGDDPDLPEELQQVGRQFFAVDPSEGLAVSFYDLSAETRDALEVKRGDADAEGWRAILGVRKARTT